jgi:anti-sigma-K factor RskA
VSDIDIHLLAAAYALDALDDRERAAFEAHYPVCAICRPEVAGFRETLAQVAAAVAVAPPASVRAGVMAGISATRQLSPGDSVVDLAGYRQRRLRVLRVVTVAAAVILLVIGGFVVGRRSSDGNGYADAAAAVLARTDTRIATLEGTGVGSFKIAWSASADEVVVIGDGLTDPGPGNAYELWRIDDTGPHPVRLLDNADGGRVRRVLTVDGSPDQWAVTVEPESGVDAPTGGIIFAGAV